MKNKTKKYLHAMPCKIAKFVFNFVPNSIQSFYFWPGNDLHTSTSKQNLFFIFYFFFSYFSKFGLLSLLQCLYLSNFFSWDSFPFQ